MIGPADRMTAGADEAIPARRRKRQSLANRALATVCLLVGSLLAADGWVSLRQSELAGKAALIERGRLLAAVQAESLAAAIWDFASSQVESIVDALVIDPDLVRATVRDQANELMAERVPGVAKPDDIVIRQPILRREDGREERLGELELVLSRARQIAASGDAAMGRIPTLLVLVMAVLAVILVIFRQVTGPLNRMAELMTRLARGDATVQIPALDRQDEIGNIARAIDVFKRNAREVGELRAAKDHAVAVERLRIGAAVQSSSDAVIITDAGGEAVFVNRAFEELLGVSLRELQRLDPLTLLADRRAMARIRAQLRRRGRADVEASLQSRGGTAVPVRLRVDQIAAEDGLVEGHVAIATDISARLAAERRISHLAYHDALTGLPNRLRFRERLNEALQQTRRENRCGALLLLDLDRFKTINDTLGHAVGDALLCEIGRRLTGGLRGAGSVMRLGGDEFAVVLSELARAEEAIQVAERLLQRIVEPVTLVGRVLVPGSSIGIASFPEHGDAADVLLRRADMALYAAKAAGRGGLGIYAPEMEVESLRRAELETELRAALAANDLVLHFQPQLALSTGRISGAEALVRWPHPRRGLIPPMEFVGIAEERGMIGELGGWVLAAACRQMAAWKHGGEGPAVVAVNLSPGELRDDLPDAVAALLRSSGLAADCLELEITESTLLKDTEVNLDILRRLRAIGVRLALDDFGTGYSSLSYLQTLPVQRLKIDRSFICDLVDRPASVAIVRTIIDLAHALEMRVTAEGVETAAQLEILQRLNCDDVQGFLIGRAGSPENLRHVSGFEPRVLKRNRPRTAQAELLAST